jgi:hypothetical protein
MNSWDKKSGKLADRDNGVVGYVINQAIMSGPVKRS